MSARSALGYALCTWARWLSLPIAYRTPFIAYYRRARLQRPAVARNTPKRERSEASFR
ncbi:MAG: hypothetical protein ACTHKH_10235 [Trinickia sp.]